MKAMLSAAAEAMHGRLIGDDAGFAGVSTDTRSIGRGELFVALTGPNFDGAEFVAEARRRGATGAVVARRVDDTLPQILVDDTRKALGELAAHWRRQHPAVVIGITGSNGKTTLKELTAACVAQAGSTLATAGNLNNDIGVPLMLLRLRPEHRYAVIEMGANHGGEIAYLTELASPNVVTITNAEAELAFRAREAQFEESRHQVMFIDLDGAWYEARVDAAGIPSNATEAGLMLYDPSQNGVVLRIAS